MTNENNNKYKCISIFELELNNTNDYQALL